MICSKHFLYIIAFLYVVGVEHFLYAQNTPQKLPTTRIIGTEVSVDYNNNNIASTTVNTIANVFDGNFTTFFASYERSRTWVGLDLGEKHIITRVAYCPRQSQPSRLLLGVIEGANREDFLDAIPLLLITETPPENKMTEQTIDCSRGFRYVRYVGPNDVRCNIAELEFWGYAGNGNDLNLFQTTNLPDVIIHTNNAQDIVEKEVFLNGYVSVISENGTKIYGDGLEIRGRGNASWGFPKKPYRIKLNNKASLLNLPSTERNWTLINNYGDKTLMRNLLAFDLSQRLQMPYTPAGTPVNLYLNGEFKGCYQLCDHIDVSPTRVNVEKMTASDVALPNLSGGYLVEIDAYWQTEKIYFHSQRNVPVSIKYPDSDEIISTQTNYIRTAFNQMENALYSADYRNSTTGYRKYMDMETFIRHFLVGEFSGNTDTYWSVYMYKKRNNDRFYFGPVWDFDLAYENDNRTYPINNNPNWIYASTGSAASNTREMVNRLFTDVAFVNQLKTIYAYYRDQQIISEEALIAVVDRYAEELETSQKLNFVRWNIMNSKVHQNPTVHGSYTAEVQNVKNYIKSRITWMDRKIGYTPKKPEDPDKPIVTASDEIYLSDATVRAYAGHIYIEGINAATLVEIFDVTGNRLLSKTIHNDTSMAFRSGIYIIRLANGERNIKVVRCSLE